MSPEDLEKNASTPPSTPNNANPTNPPSTQPNSNSVPTVLSTERSNKFSNYFLTTFIVTTVVFVLIGLILVKVYQPDIFSWPDLLTNKNQQSSPKPSSMEASAPIETKPIELDSQVKIAFQNARKIMSEVDLNSPFLYKSSIYYTYKAKVASLSKTVNDLPEITTDRSLPGLPSIWIYNKRTNTFSLGEDDVMKKADPNQVRKGNSIQVNVSYIVNTKFEEEIPDKFNLDNVMILPDSSTLTTLLNPNSSSFPEMIATNENSVFKIENPITKKAFVTAQNIMNQIDLRAKASDSGLLYIYEGKLSKVSQLPDGSIEITTDTEVKGLPKTWKLDNNSLIFEFPSKDRIDKSALKIGDTVRVATVFVIQTSWEEVYKQNQFVVSSVSRQN
jgi:hypothetical protein